MKRLVSIACFLLCGSVLFAQDIITKKDGTDIQAKVTEVSQNEVSYKKFSNLEGPTYTMDLADVLMITYQNGEREVYNVDNSSSKIGLPRGVMTYSPWSGKIFVSGLPIEDGLLGNYFSPEEISRYKGGRFMFVAGGIAAVIGAFPFGYGTGSLIAWNRSAFVIVNPQAYNTAKILTIAGGALFLSGIAVTLIGEGQMKTVINRYNSSLTFNPTLHFGATENGMGLAFVF